MAAPKMFDLSGEVAVVTGGNGGIGRGIALGFAEAGAAVAILARNEEKNRAVVDELTKAGVPALAVPLDVTRRDDLRPAMEEVERKHQVAAEAMSESITPADKNAEEVAQRRGTQKPEALKKRFWRWMKRNFPQKSRQKPLHTGRRRMP